MAIRENRGRVHQKIINLYKILESFESLCELKNRDK